MCALGGESMSQAIKRTQKLKKNNGLFGIEKKHVVNCEQMKLGKKLKLKNDESQVLPNNKFEVRRSR